MLRSLFTLTLLLYFSISCNPSQSDSSKANVASPEKTNTTTQSTADTNNSNTTSNTSSNSSLSDWLNTDDNTTTSGTEDEEDEEYFSNDSEDEDDEESDSNDTNDNEESDSDDTNDNEESDSNDTNDDELGSEDSCTDLESDDICDDEQYFYNTSYKMQVLSGDSWQNIIIKEHNYYGQLEYGLSYTSDSSSETFKFILSEDDDYSSKGISDRNISKTDSSLKGSYIYSAKKKQYLCSTSLASYLVSFGSPNGTGDSPNSSTGYVELTIDGEGDYLIHDEEADNCPSDKWCSEPFTMKFPNDSNRWLSKNSTGGDILARDSYADNRLSFRLLKDIPEN